MTDSISNDLAAHAQASIRGGAWDRHLGSLQLAIEDRITEVFGGWPTGWTKAEATARAAEATAPDEIAALRKVLDPTNAESLNAVAWVISDTTWFSLTVRYGLATEILTELAKLAPPSSM